MTATENKKSIVRGMILKVAMTLYDKDLKTGRILFESMLAHALSDATLKELRGWWAVLTDGNVG